MGFKYFVNSVYTVKRIMSFYIKKGQIVVDCTIGNGHDTLLLANLVGDDGKVYGFDIQSIAINRTKELLIKHGLDERVILINDGHENIGSYIKNKIHLAVYNLGYLPGGDKRIITTPTTTLKGIAKTLKLLHSNGILLITSYTGHRGGLTEKKEIEKYLKTLDQKRFNVLEFSFINQKNNPPTLYGIEKL